MQYLNHLINHTIWANEKWIDFYTLKLPEDEHLCKILCHILLGEQVWFQRIRGEKLNRKIWRILSSEKLHSMQQENSKIYRQLLDSDLAERIEFQRFTGETGTSSIGNILLHLCTHGSHHRGQIASHVSSIGLKPINTDYIAYIGNHHNELS